MVAEVMAELDDDAPEGDFRCSRDDRDILECAEEGEICLTPEDCAEVRRAYSEILARGHAEATR